MLDSSLLAYQSNFVNISGYSMHYLDVGPTDSTINDPSERPVVVCLHGNPTWCYYYRHLVERLKENYRVVVPDMIGCGWSDHPAKSFRAAERIEHLVEFLKKLEIKRINLVLHDWGGPIGSGAAIELADQVDSIVYLNTTLTEIESLPSMIKTAATPLVGQFLTQMTKRFLKLMLKYGVVRNLSAKEQYGYLAPYLTVARRRAIWDFVKDIPFTSEHPTYQTLNRLGAGLTKLQNKPIKIIWGLKDPCFHRGCFEKVVSHFPSAEVHEFKDASHLVLEDKPSEIGQLIDDFLKKNSQPSPSKDLKAAGLNSSNTTKSINQEDSSSDGSVLYRYFQQTVLNNPQADLLIETVGDNPHQEFRRISRADFLRKVTKYQRGLLSLGLQSGDTALMLVPAGFEMLSLTYAVLACGATPIFVDPGVGRKNLIACIEDSRPSAFISVPKGYMLKMLARKGFKNCKLHITVTNLRIPGLDHTTRFLERFSPQPVGISKSSGMELVAFTSGATGTPKGVVYTPQNIEALLKILQNRLSLKSGDIDLPLLPIFSIFNVALGVTTVIAPIDQSAPLQLNPEKVISVIKNHRVNSSFGSPTLWQKLGEYCQRSQVDLSNMQRILIAGAPVSDKLLNTLGTVIGNERVFTPYGSTEALPVTVLSAAERENTVLLTAKGGEQGTLVGKSIPEVRIKIVKPDSLNDGATPLECQLGEIGEVLVLGPHVSQYYLNRPDAFHRYKLSDPESGSFWHRMGDLGYLDGDDNLYFCGRVAHQVVTKDQTYYSVPTERITNSHPYVRRSALVDLKGRAGICIEPYPEYFPNEEAQLLSFEQEILRLLASNSVTENIKTIFFHPSFPVDGRHNAKIFRDQLSLWARAKIDRIDNRKVSNRKDW